MWFVQLLLLFSIASVGPGLFFARRLRLSPSEKLTVSVALSFLLVYAGSFAVYALGLSSRWQLLVTAGCLTLTAASLRDLRRLFKNHQVRRILAAYLALVVWGLLLLAFVRGFGGGTWGGDWLEHYQRSIFLLGGSPRDFKFIDIYLLPARPPLMNALTAHFLANVGSDFEVFQVVFLLLNALALLPCCLIAGELLPPSASSSRRAPWMLLLLLSASPMFCQNLTYAWTKLFTMFYVLLALHLYLRAWRKGRPGAGRSPLARASSGDWPTGAGGSTREVLAGPSLPLFVLAFICLCGGILTHYSAGPYALFIGLHYLIVVWWRRPRPALEAAVITGVCGAILASWFVWSVHAYGPRITFASNSSVIDSAPMSPRENALNKGKNLLDAAVPPILRRPSMLWRDEDLDQPTVAGRVRDFAFLCYQVTATLGLGSAGLILVGYLLIGCHGQACSLAFGADRNRGKHGQSNTLARAHPKIRPCEGVVANEPNPNETLFWAVFVPFVYCAGILVYGGRDRFGVAHICLQGLILVGLTLVAAGWRRIRSSFRWVLVPGLLLDFSVGIFLHFTLESRNPQGNPSLPDNNAYLSRAAQANWSLKTLFSLPFWGDRFADFPWLLQPMAIAGVLFFAWLALRPRAGARVPAVLRRNTPAPPRKREASLARRAKRG